MSTRDRNSSSSSSSPSVLPASPQARLLAYQLETLAIADAPRNREYRQGYADGYRDGEDQARINAREATYPQPGQCWCSPAWRSTRPRNHQDSCVAEWNRRTRAARESRPK